MANQPQLSRRKALQFLAGAPLLPPPGSPPPAVPYNVPTTAPLLPPAAAVAP